MVNLHDIIFEALDDKYGNDPKAIANEGLDWVAMIINKNLNYGSAIFKKPMLCDMPISSAILVRMRDKISRLMSLAKGDKDRIGESFDDTVRDLGAYCLLYLVGKKLENISDRG